MNVGELRGTVPQSGFWAGKDGVDQEAASAEAKAGSWIARRWTYAIGASGWVARGESSGFAAAFTVGNGEEDFEGTGGPEVINADWEPVTVENAVDSSTGVVRFGRVLMSCTAP